MNGFQLIIILYFAASIISGIALDGNPSRVGWFRDSVKAAFVLTTLYFGNFFN
jgi:hypothetical protein